MRTSRCILLVHAIVLDIRQLMFFHLDEDLSSWRTAEVDDVLKIGSDEIHAKDCGDEGQLTLSRLKVAEKPVPGILDVVPVGFPSSSVSTADPYRLAFLEFKVPKTQG